MSLIAFVFGIYSCFEKNYQVLWPMTILSVVLLFFANLDKISKLRFDKTGFEAETREVVKEARSTIKELQDLSKIMASTTLGLVKRTGRWGGYSYAEKEEIKKQTLNVLEKIGISPEDVEKVITESKWHKFTELDYVHFILGGDKIPEILPSDRIAQWKQLRHRDLDNLATPDELTHFFEQSNMLSPETKELIEDYSHYIRTRQQRRPDVWNNRGSWSHLK